MDISKFRAAKDIPDDNWDAWLSDESERRSGRQARKVSSPSAAMRGSQARPTRPVAQRPAREPKAPPVASQGISINIQMPHIPKGAVRKAWRRGWPWAAGAAVLVGVVVGGNYAMSHLGKGSDGAQSLLPTDTRAAVDLGYKPIVPDTSERPEGSAMPSDPVYYAEQKVYSFTDSYNGVNITVDQQALPDSFRDNPNAILSVAQDINATDDFTTTLGTVYIFTAPTSGAQRLVLANDKMLMFLQSTQTLSNADWVSYIQSLK